MYVKNKYDLFICGDCSRREGREIKKIRPRFNPSEIDNAGTNEKTFTCRRCMSKRWLAHRIKKNKEIAQRRAEWLAERNRKKPRRNKTGKLIKIGELNYL
jgi:hypothetical protein